MASCKQQPGGLAVARGTRALSLAGAATRQACCRRRVPRLPVEPVTTRLLMQCFAALQAGARVWGRCAHPTLLPRGLAGGQRLLGAGAVVDRKPLSPACVHQAAPCGACCTTHRHSPPATRSLLNHSLLNRSLPDRCTTCRRHRSQGLASAPSRRCCWPARMASPPLSASLACSRACRAPGQQRKGELGIVSWDCEARQALRMHARHASLLRCQGHAPASFAACCRCPKGLASRCQPAHASLPCAPCPACVPPAGPASHGWTASSPAQWAPSTNPPPTTPRAQRPAAPQGLPARQHTPAAAAAAAAVRHRLHKRGRSRFVIL